MQEKKKPEITNIFNQTAAPSFAKKLDLLGESGTAKKVQDALAALQLPVPEKESEFILSKTGAFLVSNELGVIIRIEERYNYLSQPRVEDHPMVLQPLGSFTVGNMLIEICPGVHPTTLEKYSDFLKDKLPLTGSRFWDKGAHNVGLLPFATKDFPDGIPVVIDRPAVIADKTVDAVKALDILGLEKDAQGMLYGPLRRAFKDAYPEGAAAPDAEKMKTFWNLCAENQRKGKLVAGWHEGNKHADGNPKQLKARSASVAYDDLLRRMNVLK